MKTLDADRICSVYTVYKEKLWNWTPFSAKGLREFVKEALDLTPRAFTFLYTVFIDGRGQSICFLYKEKPHFCAALLFEFLRVRTVMRKKERPDFPGVPKSGCDLKS